MAQVFNYAPTDQGGVQLNLAVQGYFTQLVAQFQKNVIKRIDGSSSESHAQ